MEVNMSTASFWDTAMEELHVFLEGLGEPVTKTVLCGKLMESSWRWRELLLNDVQGLSHAALYKVAEEAGKLA